MSFAIICIITWDYISYISLDFIDIRARHLIIVVPLPGRRGTVVWYTSKVTEYNVWTLDIRQVKDDSGGYASGHVPQ